jgi:hypothetical protein
MENTAVLKQNLPIKTSSNRSFGIVFTCFFLLVALLPLLHHHIIRWWALILAACFFVVALIVPKILRPLNYLWTRFSILLSKITTPIVMGIIFFAVLTPMSLCRRLFKRLPLTLEPDPKQPSYWITREPPGFNAQGMKNQF